MNGQTSAVIKQQGISLVMVLWLLAIMTVMALSFSHSIRTDIMLATNYRHQAQAQALAEAGIWRAVAMRLNAGARQNGALPVRLDGFVYKLESEQGELWVSLQSNSGLLDLNRAPATLIRHLLSTLTTDPAQINTVTDSLLDWRDEDDLTHLAGAENADYAAMGLNYGAKNGLMNSKNELARIQGVDQTLFNRLSPLVTVYSGQARIALNTAPPQLLLALPGMEKELVDKIMATRQQGQTVSLELIPAETRNFIGAGQDDYIRISSRAKVNNTVAGVVAEIQLAATPSSPVTIVLWQQEIDTVFERSFSEK